MKKVISLILILCMAISAVPTLAEEVKIPRDSLLEEITRIAEEYGGKVSVYGDSIVLAKDGRNMIITKDTVSYMEKGMLVTESIFSDEMHVKVPENALKSVLGVDSISLKMQKTQAYYDKIESFKQGFCAITERVETDWGTIVEYSNYLYIPPWGYESYKNHLCYVRWDGQSAGISSYAPEENHSGLIAYESIEISEDGRTALVKYPELRNLGTICVEVDLVNCTAVKTTIPYVKKEEQGDITSTDETASGKCQGYSHLQERPDTNVMWEYNNGTLTITGDEPMHDFFYTYGGRTQHTVRTSTPWDYTSKIKRIIISEGVKSVSRYAFENCVNLEEVVIADNVAINTGAFNYLKNLEKVHLGKNCIIGEEAFRGCTAICEITIPEGTAIQHNAFYNCHSLNKVNFEGRNINLTDTSFEKTPFYATVDEIVIGDELLWIKNAKKLESYIVPEGITRIGANVFSGGNLKEIKLPESLVEIGNGAFLSCDFTEIKLPSNLKKIGSEAFNFCKFAEIKFPQSLEYIGDKAFASSALTSVTIGKNVVVADAKSQYSGGAFDDCENLETVVFEEGVEKIAAGMFYGCKRLESVKIPDSVKVIGNRAFERCEGLISLPIGKAVTEIGHNAYEYCNNITFADISHVQNIGSGVFKECDKLTKVVLNENLTEIPSELFYGCNSLAEVNIPKNITAINDSAFCYTKSLTGEFVIPDTVTSIGNSVFRQSGFSSIIMPDSITEVGTYLAEEMPNLTHIRLSESLTTIPMSTFKGVKSLAKITIPQSVTEIGNSAFSDCESLEEIMLPDGVTKIGDYAFCNCKKLSEFRLPAKLTHIGKNAFLDSGIYLNDAYWTDGGLYMLNILFDVRDDREVFKVKEGTAFIAPLAFEKTKNIKEVYIPGSVKQIDSYVFSYSGVKNVFINEGVEVICSNAFYQASLEKVSLPDSLKTIESDAFSYCNNIKELTIPAKVEIEKNAFEDFEAKLEKLTFKEGREEIDMHAAFGYSKIKEVVLPEGLKKIGDKMFYEWKNLESINCPESLEEIGEEAFYNCDKLTAFYGGESLKMIGNRAFSGCDELKVVTYSENAQLGENVFEQCPLMPHH
ncbi:MAG: leucine-rich repeat domain-containing protein [Clostridia bacterium]|nr:leucine-rich repeat domain-containing protein [Clostridia bacterium]